MVKFNEQCMLVSFFNILKKPEISRQIKSVVEITRDESTRKVIKIVQGNEFIMKIILWKFLLPQDVASCSYNVCFYIFIIIAKAVFFFSAKI